MSGTRTYSGNDFAMKLMADELEAEPAIVLRGFAKKADQANIDFASMDCTSWIRIPVSSISRVEFLRVARCKDHTHPLVDVYLKPPESTDGRLYVALFQQHSVSEADCGWSAGCYGCWVRKNGHEHFVPIMCMA